MIDISILIITYNQEHYITECLESILMQIIPYDFEIIISDDCSIDSTLLIANQILKQSSFNYRILENNQNVGIAKNYQKGFKECSGQYIAVMEGDDYWIDPERLQKHITFLNGHKDCVLSYNRICQYYEELDQFIIPKWSYKADFEYISTSRLARGNCIGNLSACVFRNSAIQKLKPDLFNIEIADWMLGMVLGQFGSIAYLKETTSVYRINSKGQWSKMSSSEQLQSIIRLIDIYNKYLAFKYSKEFGDYKARLLRHLRRESLKSRILKLLPSSFILVIKWMIPIKLRRLIKRKFI